VTPAAWNTRATPLSARRTGTAIAHVAGHRLGVERRRVHARLDRQPQIVPRAPGAAEPRASR
jgi:hypothetical protein